MNYLGRFDISNIIRHWRNARRDHQLEEIKIFLTAVENSELTEVGKSIEKGVNVNCTYSENSITALHIVAERGNVPILLKLLDCPDIIIDPISLYGFTPLHTACMYQKYEVMKILLERGANPNQVDDFDKTCLHLIAPTKHIRLARLLIRFDAHINVIDYIGNSPLHLAIDSEYMPMIKLLLKCGADPNIVTKRMPLFLDCVLQCHSDRQLSIMKILIAYGANYNVIEPISKRNAIHFVAISGYTPLAYMLLKLDCNPNLRDIFNKTAEDIAISHCNHSLADLLHTYQEYGDIEFIALFQTDKRDHLIEDHQED